MKKLLLITLLSFVFISVKAQDEVNTGWEYHDKVNEMTNDHSYYAKTSTYNGKFNTTITVRYSKKENEVLLSSDDGVFNISGGWVTFRTKFDDSKIEKFSALGSSDNGFQVIFIHSAKGFIKKLKTAKTTFIEIEMYNGGVNTFKFNTENLKWDHS